MVLAPIMAEGIRAQEQCWVEDIVKKLKNSWDKQVATLSKLLKMIANMNLKFEHMIFRIDKLGNGDNASINRNGTNNKLHGTNSFQTKFFKFWRWES